MTELPKSWAECRLSDIAEVNPSLDRCPYPQDGAVHFVPMGAVEAENGHIDVSAMRPYSEVRKGYTAFVPGDVLFAKITPCMENGKMAVVPDLPNSVGCGSTEFHVLRAKEEISPDYIYYFVSSKSFRFEAEHKMTGAVGQKRVPTSFVAEHTLPFPPLPEQHRIVARIEELFSELDASVESLTRARALLGLYRQSLLKAAFQGKLTADWRAANPDKLEPPETLLSRIRKEREARYAKALEDWEAEAKARANGDVTRRPNRPRRPDPVSPVSYAELSELPALPCEWAYLRPSEMASPGNYSIGIGPFGSNLKVSDYRPAGIPLIFVKNITRRNFGLDLKYVTEAKAAELLAHSAEPNDILITKMGDPPGQCAIYPSEAPVAIITADCLKFRVWEEFFDRRFVAYLIESTPVQKQLGLLVRGVAQKKISVERFKTIAMPVPSLPEQVEIGNRLDACLSVVQVMDFEITSALTRIEALRQSVLNRAFSGRLVPQDPNDEPASALLARLQYQTPTTPIRRRGRA